MHYKHCEECGTRFLAARSDAKTCSAACRKALSRGGAKTTVTRSNRDEVAAERVWQKAGETVPWSVVKAERDLRVRVLAEKGWTTQQIADAMDDDPEDVSRVLAGDLTVTPKVTVTDSRSQLRGFTARELENRAKRLAKAAQKSGEPIDWLDAVLASAQAQIAVLDEMKAKGERLTDEDRADAIALIAESEELTGQLKNLVEKMD